MNKSDLHQIILLQLEQNLLVAQAATQRAIDAATDEETVPEHKYDTLALEASYLAHGQAMRVQECEEDIRVFKELVLREASDTVVMASLVTVANEENERKYFFIGPRAGGVSVDCQGIEVSVLTPQAPLGKALLGRQVEDEIELAINGITVYYEVMDIA
ncbi:GreA/GreB family elongation factor [Vibrio paucivorans]|uniref:GreA/GreB family elongation factor n=1 Tax=Vibrio paucivorans TaxID=2829489 RepID=A0A9X3CG83_9VIBR|nr:GreA/GreB family elongation factor [Vibrio paucivorans]MCW8335146.1 GreA/GreB family elongation factor [Vibrio paucivorans]